MVIFHSYLKLPEGNHPNYHGKTHYFILFLWNNGQPFRSFWMFGNGSKLGTPKLWMVNTKLDFHICGPTNGLPFWPTSVYQGYLHEIHRPTLKKPRKGHLCSSSPRLVPGAPDSRLEKPMDRWEGNDGDEVESWDMLRYPLVMSK